MPLIDLRERHAWRLTMRKMIFAVLGIVIAVMLIDAGSVKAQNYPWCAQRADGAINCGFVSYEQCRMAGSWCNRNPMYQPPAEEPQFGRRLRGRRG
jgi:hypothetical protein